MKYRDLILASYEKLGYDPKTRPFQIGVINQVIEAFVDSKKRDVVLSAPTGAGKSVLGLIISDVLSEVRYPGKSKGTLKTIFNTGTIVLSKQYAENFERTSNFNVLKGAANYRCDLLSENAEEDATAEQCVKKVVKNNPVCATCEYNLSRKTRNTTEHVVTTYAMFYIDRLFAHFFEKRELVVWDEAHLISDLFCEHSGIFYSAPRLEVMKKEVQENFPRREGEVLINRLSRLQADLVRQTDDTYLVWLEGIKGVLRTCKNKFDIEKTRFEDMSEDGEKVSPEDMKAFMHWTKLFKKYEGLLCKIGDFEKYKYEHVFDPKDESYSIKPVFINTMMRNLQNNNHNLFMSGTISSEYAVAVLGLDPENMEFIKLPPVFPAENKLVAFYDFIPMNYQSLKDPETIKTITADVNKILDEHVELEESGIIQTPSFALQQHVVDSLRDRTDYVLFVQQPGEKLEQVLQRFKVSKVPSLLISPSVYEGIDLPGDQSRFAIMLKVPYASLGDKRISYILKKFPEMYSEMALTRVIQGLGRSVRSEEDFSVTYFLDSNAKRLLTSKQNIWRDEFEIL